MQQEVVTVSQGDKVILEGEKCGGLYKIKEGNSVRGGVSGISLEGSFSRGGVSRKTATGCELNKSVVKRRRGVLGKGPSHSGKSAKGPEEKGQELKVSPYGYNQENNQGSNPKSQGVLLKA